MGFKGNLTGVPSNANLESAIGTTYRCTFSGADKQVYNGTSTYQLSIAAGTTTTIDLTTGLTNPMGQPITSGLAFAKVYVCMVMHDIASQASSVKVFGAGAGTDFQGPLVAAGYLTLTPGRGNAFMDQTTANGMAVSGTAKTIAIQNLDGANTALVNVFVMGTTT